MSIPFKSYPTLFILRKIGETYKIICKKTFSISDKSKTIDKTDYIIDLSYAITSKKNQPQLFYIYNNPHPLSFVEFKTKANPETLKIVTHNKILHQLFSGDTEKLLLFLCIGSIVAVLILTFALTYYLNEFSQLENYVKILLNQTSTPPNIPAIPKVG